VIQLKLELVENVQIVTSMRNRMMALGKGSRSKEMDYTENREQIIKDNPQVDRQIVEEFLDSQAYKEWIQDYQIQKITDPIEEWIASGIRLWRDGLL
jgi:hypothetical protein